MKCPGERRSWTLGLLALLALAPARADAEASAWKPEARRHVTRGLQLYEQGRLPEALEELEAGHAADPRPELLYALGQVHRRLGQCREAITYYQRFLAAEEGDASDQRIAATQQHLATCRRQLAAEPEPEPGLEPPLVVLPASSRPPAVDETRAPSRLALERPPPSRSWTDDWLGHALTGTGIVTAGVGTVVVIQATRTIAAPVMVYGDLARAHVADARRKTGAALIAAGGALIAGGVVSYWLHARPAPSGLSLAVAATPSSFALAGEF